MGLFTKFLWRDENVQYPNRYLVDGVYKTITRDVGTVTVQDALSSTRLNRIESGLFDSYYAHGQAPFEGVVQDLVYTSGNLSSVVETIASKKYRETLLTYTSGTLTSVVTKIYDVDGTTVLKQVTDVLTYTSGTLEYVTRTVNV